MGLLYGRLEEPSAVTPTPPRTRIHIVDDDTSVCKAVARLLELEGYSVCVFQSAESFLERPDPDDDGCILLDIGMTGLDGLSLQQVLSERGNDMPIIFLTGRADVPMSVRAMKGGAFDFLTKPYDDAVLLAAVASALEKNETLRRIRAHRLSTESRLATLTPREREVLQHVIAGRLNKQIAADLGTCEKTIKVHRARGIKKMCVRSVAELVRIVDRARPRSLDDGAWP
ncbi:response regulator [Aquabacterium sp. A7-Y]|uniref:response regulator transcription factor n=1 Tax=Aquabacterium sp. A7-Y TaxID=1349605 RepID=UPI00223D589C|nr:response regulator [Aquabacterium sp. A7-Y]MCW7538553.1 response regulator [Aquabacterium sp. A7-Y]